MEVLASSSKKVKFEPVTIQVTIKIDKVSDYSKLIKELETVEMTDDNGDDLELIPKILDEIEDKLQ